MKTTYKAPKLSIHGTVTEMTNFFGNGRGDVLRGPDGNAVSNANGSINACAEQSGQCIPR